MTCPLCDPAVAIFLEVLEAKQAAEDLQESMIRMKKRHTKALEKQIRKKKSVRFELYK